MAHPIEVEDRLKHDIQSAIHDCNWLLTSSYYSEDYADELITYDSAHIQSAKILLETALQLLRKDND
jgi:hypothetical protein